MPWSERRIKNSLFEINEIKKRSLVSFNVHRGWNRMFDSTTKRFIYYVNFRKSHIKRYVLLYNCQYFVFRLYFQNLNIQIDLFPFKAVSQVEYISKRLRCRIISYNEQISYIPKKQYNEFYVHDKFEFYLTKKDYHWMISF